MRSSKRLAALPVLAAVVLAAGCGGKSSTPPTATDWANGLCTAITTWKNSITSSADSLKGGNISKSGLQSATDSAKSATSTFVDSVKKLGKPNTQAGAQAKQDVDQLSQQLDDGTSKIQTTVSGASGLTGFLSAISVVSATLVTMGNEVTTTFDDLQQLDAKGELQTAFDQASACKSLKSSS